MNTSTNCEDMCPEQALNSACFFLTFLILSLHLWLWAILGGRATRWWGRGCGLPLFSLRLCDLTLFWFAVLLRVITWCWALFLLLFWLGFLHFLLWSTFFIRAWAIFLLLPLWWRFIALLSMFRRIFSTRGNIRAARLSLQFSWFSGPLSCLLFDPPSFFFFQLYVIEYEFLPSDSQKWDYHLHWCSVTAGQLTL